MFGSGKIANAFGKILKLSSGPDIATSYIEMPYYRQKCPKYINTIIAHSNPHIRRHKDIMKTPDINSYFLFFMLEKLITVPHPILI